MTARPRRSLSFGALMGGVAAVSALAIAMVVFAYFHFLRYERVALAHLPDDSVASAHMDVEQVAAYEPVRQHWIPIVDAIDPPDATRLRRLEERSGLRRRDLREIVVGSGPSASDWTLILGGLFPTDGVIDRLGAVLAEDHTAWSFSKNKGAIIDGKTGAAITQAPDGAVIIASSIDRALKARAGGYRHAGLEFSKGQVASFAVRGDSLASWAHLLPGEVSPLIEKAGGVRLITGTVRLGEPMMVNVAVFPSTRGSVADTEAWVTRTLEAMRTWLQSQSAADEAGERAILDRATVSTTKTSATVSFTWEPHEVDRAAARVTDAVLALLNGPR